ncbi:MAG: hypothetical protein AAGA90_08315 [Actinomycetota bacterium]
MFTLFALSRMVIRAGVLAALIATVISVASAFAVQGEWDAIESHAETAFDWLADLVGRLGDVDPSVGDITLADLMSPSGWIDLGAGLFGGGEQPAEVDPVELARLVDGSVVDLSVEELADLRGVTADPARLGVDLEGIDLGDIDVPALGGD